MQVVAVLKKTVEKMILARAEPVHPVATLLFYLLSPVKFTI